MNDDEKNFEAFRIINQTKDVLAEECSCVKIFGKPTAPFGRRMGVVLCYGDINDSTDTLRDKAKRLATTVLGTEPYMKK